jgi:GH35 family endo-1,4-beta-xylanase
MIFRPYPHPMMPEMTFAYASDTNGDPFKSSLAVGQDGIVVPEGASAGPFAVNARWFIEGFGYVWLEADNEGAYYRPEDVRSAGTLNLNVEFARSYVARNAAQLARYEGDGTAFSTEVRGLHDLGRGLLEEALRLQGEAAGRRADQALLYALWAGEKIELEKAESDIARQQRADEFFFGCETRQYVWAKSETFVERFTELFNYATITHYVYDTWYEEFEPREGEYRWGLKDNIVGWLKQHQITIEGRPLFWFHRWVTPEWLQAKSYDELRDYVVRHTRDLVYHYGDDVLHWEVVNEYHDWANVHNLLPEQITEITRLACETTHAVNPRVHRLINNCCTFAEYAARGRAGHGEVDRPLRSARRFIQDLVEAEVPFEVLGLQLYYPHRSLADIVRNVERFVEFGKPIYVTEMGTSSGPTREEIVLGTMKVAQGPYDWHRPWDEDLQADWLEQMYTILYSKPYVQAICWYDFADFRTFIQNGGLTRVDGTPKASFNRLKDLLAKWNRLPGQGAAGGP